MEFKLRKLIEWCSTTIAIVLTLAVVVFSLWTPYTSISILHSSSVELFKISMKKIEVIEKIPPPYHNCEIEHNWCSRLAEALVYEARGEGSVGMRAVAYVILERVKSKGWPNSIRSVIEQRKQFSYLQDMHLQKEPSQEDFDKAYKEAYDAVFGISENPVPGAKWYHSTGIKPPKWTKNLDVVKVIGGHIFYREKS